MVNVSVYEQECWGVIHWRVMRDDGQLIFGRHQTDFPAEQEAVAAITGEFRRKQLGPAQVTIHMIDQQAGGRRHVSRTIVVNAATVNAASDPSNEE